MKVLLTSLPLSERWLPTLDRVNGHYPLGLAYLHAVLEQAGHEVLTLPLNDLPEAEGMARFESALTDFAPDVIGFNVLTDNRVTTYRGITVSRDLVPDARLVAGGIHTSVMFRQMVEALDDLVCVLGEAEETLPDLLNAFVTGRDLNAVDGIGFRENGRTITTRPRELPQDLDILPFPRHDLFFSPERTHAHILSSRGCPFHCSFCVLDSNSRRKMRFRSPENVVDEIEHILRTQPQVKTITFMDDQFLANNKRVIALCEEIVRRDVKCHFVCQGRVKPVSQELVRAMQTAGFTTVYLGLESGSAEILDRCHKKITPEDVVNAVDLFRHAKMALRVLLIVGLPGETLRTTMETAHLCQTLQAMKYHRYDDRVQILFVYPGAEVYDHFKAAGRIDDGFWLGADDVPFFTAEHDIDALGRLKQILQIYLSGAQVFTPYGLRAQKKLLTPMMAYAFRSKAPEAQPLKRLVEIAVARLMARDALSFTLNRDTPFPPDGKLEMFHLKPSAEADGRFDLVWETTDQSAIVMAAVKTAYIAGQRELTSRVNAEIVAYLEECFERGEAPELQGMIPAAAFSATYGITEDEFTETERLFDEVAASRAW